LLFEGSGHGAKADVITSRTFHIPASGGFMLHERTPEVQELFEEGKECAFFSDAQELARKVEYYLTHDEERRHIAEAGRTRCIESGYSVDDRASAIEEKYHELRTARRRAHGESARASGG
jgi:spore maturation protein CgeB